jgi:hypothetical protein
MLFGIDNLIKKKVIKVVIKKIFTKERVEKMPTQGQVRKYGTWLVAASIIIQAIAPGIGIDPATAGTVPNWVNPVLIGIGYLFQLLKKDA